MIAVATVTVWACQLRVWYYQLLHKFLLRWQRGFELRGSSFVLLYGPDFRYNHNARTLRLLWNHRYGLNPHYCPRLGESLYADEVGLVWWPNYHVGSLGITLFRVGSHMKWDEVYK